MRFQSDLIPSITRLLRLPISNLTAASKKPSPARCISPNLVALTCLFSAAVKLLFLFVLLVFAVTAQAQSCATLWRLQYNEFNTPPVGAPYTGTDKAAVCQASAYPVFDHIKANQGGTNGYTYSPPMATVQAYQTWGRCRISTVRTRNSDGYQVTLDSSETFENLGSTCEPSSDTLNRLKNAGPQRCGNSNNIGNPVNAATGNKYQEETDYVGPGEFPLQFVRQYNSQLWYGSSNPPGNTGEFWSKAGYNWRTNYDRSIRYFTTAPVPTAYVYRPDGRILTFRLTSGSFVSDEDISDRLTPLTDGAGNLSGWTYKTCARDEVEEYSYAGRLMSITARSGQRQTLTYNATGTLRKVTDSFGRALTFAYDVSHTKLASLTTPSGNVITYTHNSREISSVTFPDGSVRAYVYGETGTPYSLTGIIAEGGTRYSTYTYNAADPKLAISTELAGGVNHYSFSYGTGGSYTTVTDPLGVARTYDFTTMHAVAKNTAINQPCSGCGGSGAAEATYDASGNVASREDFNGNLSCYAYDLTRNLETVRVEGFSPSSTCPTNLASYAPSTGTRERKISTLWHSTFRLPTQIVDLNRTTNYTYDSNGNVLTQTITDTNVTPNVSRTWTYTYNSYGQVLTENGPRTDVSDSTTYTYYGPSATCTATVAGATTTGCRGRLNAITNALSQVTTFNEYNAHGQPVKFTDANSVVTTLTYDLRQRLTSRSMGGETTSFEYWPTGLLKKATLPDGSFTLYTYDGAHRLTELEDGEGNRIEYTLDAMGNRTAENVYDPSSALARTRTQVFNSLSQLWKQVGSAGSSAVTTTYGYDNNGNQTSAAAPLSRNTSRLYDELNRLKQITDPNSGITEYAHDAHDNLISVTDPLGLETNYDYNGFGEITQQVSPDTGTTVNTYDSGGNLDTTTDARSKTGTYSHDALNRVTSITYPDRTNTFTYDMGTNGIGRLTGASDTAHSLAWSYDAQGRVIVKDQTVGVVTKSIGYDYTDGNLTSLVTPSGQTIAYSYANGRIDSITLNTSTTILSDVLYEPFGPVAGWSWGNSTIAARIYDQDGNPTAIDSAGAYEYTYDDAFRITEIEDTVNSALTWDYDYNLLDRLTSASQIGQNQTWMYDVNGNRLAQGGTTSSTFTFASTSNRLSAVSGALTRTYTYDAAGNVTGDGTNTFTYDDAGRLISVSGGVSATYAINAVGQRIKKTVSGTNTYFVYDEAGHLLGEYDNAGNLIQEIVWLNDIPVASIRPDGGSGIGVFYIHTDHLNTPRKLTRPTDNVVVWRWDSDSFGTDLPDEDPDGNSAHVIFNLRFPGQYYDAETGLHYNYFRDYDPAIGRYIQSDPIGLEGGANLYAYVRGNPISLTDPLGLFDADAANAANNQRSEAERNATEAKANCDWDGYDYWMQQAYEALERWHKAIDQPLLPGFGPPHLGPPPQPFKPAPVPLPDIPEPNITINY